jgi:hypothetical protein
MQKKCRKISLSSINKSEIQIEQLLKLIYGITDLECQIVKVLLDRQKEHAFTCVNILTKELQKDRSLIQKSLQSLEQLGLLTREKKTLKEYRECCEKDSKNDQDKKKNHEVSTEKGFIYMYKLLEKGKLIEKMKLDADKGFNSLREYLLSL